MQDLASIIAGFSTVTDKKGREQGLTVEQLSLETGQSPKLVREKLRLLMAAGRLEVVMKPGVRLDGRRVLVPAYKIVEPKKGGKAKK